MTSDASIGGYSTLIELKSGITTFYFAMTSSIYSGGFPLTSITYRSNKMLKIGCNSNADGLYVSWLVIGTK